MQAALVEQHSGNEAVLAVSLELAKGSWKVGRSDARHNTRVKVANAPTPLARLEQVLALVEQARRRWRHRLDARALVAALLGWLRGERDRFRVVPVPTPGEEDSRHWRREHERLAHAKAQLQALEAGSSERLSARQAQPVQRLTQLRGIGGIHAHGGESWWIT